MSELEEDIHCMEEGIPDLYESTSIIWGPELNPMRSLQERTSQSDETDHENHAWLCLQPPPKPTASNHVQTPTKSEFTVVDGEVKKSGSSLPTVVPYSSEVASLLTKFGVSQDRHVELLEELEKLSK
jgi:hypothetical protein